MRVSVNQIRERVMPGPGPPKRRTFKGKLVPLSRREILRVGSLGLGGLSLPELLAARARRGANSGISSRADACIVIFLNGGPSHLDMWDMKPDAPVEIRGEFRPISTTVPGVQLCEHLPRLARCMHHATLVRSMHHSVNNSHAAAVYAALTGHDRGEQGGGARPNDYPAPGSVMTQIRPSSGTALSYVVLPYRTQEGAGGPLQPGFLAGFIGATFNPFWVTQNPDHADFQVPNLTLSAPVSRARMAARGDLLAGLDGRFGATKSAAAFDDLDGFQQRAFDLLTSDAAQRAFHVDMEPPGVRDAYGRNIYGQSVLLARRLVAAGTRVVTVSWAPDANATWDTHGGNFSKLKNTLLPQFDAACSSLITDLDQRGMLERTLVAVLGDFGRTPKINGNAGRDHWNNCYTVMLAGGGIRGGYVHGASDRIGALPVAGLVTPGDVIATLYHILGVDPHETLYDNLQRPHQLVAEGSVIENLLA